MFKEETRREFQRGIDAQVGKMKRHEERLNLRKQIREGHLNKRRKALSGDNDPIDNTNFGPDLSRTASTNSLPVPSWVRMDNLGKFAQQIKSSNFESIFEAVQAIRQLLSIEDKPPIEQIFETGVVPDLLKILSTKIEIGDPRHKTVEEEKNCKLQFEASWALTNIASGEPIYTKMLVEMGGVETFVQLLKNTKDMETADQAVWGLGNIAGDCVELRDKVLETGVFEFLLENLSNFPDKMKRNSVWTLSNFCRGKPHPPWEKISKLLDPLTQLLLQTKDYEVMVDILWAISFLSEDNEEDNNNKDTRNNGGGQEEESSSYVLHLDAIIRAGVVQQVVKSIKHAAQLGEEAWNRIGELKAMGARKDSKEEENIPPEIWQKLSTSDFLIAPCVRILGNIVSGSDRQTMEVVKAGFFDIIELCIDHRVKNIKKESCWALSNVVAGISERLELFFRRESLVKKVTNLCRNGDFMIRKEAGWCLSNVMCGATFEQLSVLVEGGFIEAMVGLLQHGQIEKVIVMAMESLEACLLLYNKHFENSQYRSNPWVEKMEALGGLDCLESIQSTSSLSDNCHEMAAQFVTNFWSDDGDCDTNDVNNSDNTDDPFCFSNVNADITNSDQNSLYNF